MVLAPPVLRQPLTRPSSGGHVAPGPKVGEPRAESANLFEIVGAKLGAIRNPFYVGSVESPRNGGDDVPRSVEVHILPVRFAAQVVQGLGRLEPRDCRVTTGGHVRLECDQR